MEKIVQFEIASLIEDPENARTHSERNISAIMDSLRTFGQVEPLVVQKKSGRVIGGNGRLQAMKLLGWRKADIVQIDIDDLKARELGIVLNRTSELAGWDWAKLTKSLEEISGSVGGILADIHVGFNEKELKKLLDKPSTESPSDAGSTPQLPEGLTYSLIVDFDNEEAQKKLLEELEKRELNCRLMIS
jgi:ParB-like chromosome segregation protein Spo0J